MRELLAVLILIMFCGMMVAALLVAIASQPILLGIIAFGAAVVWAVYTLDSKP